MLSPDHRFALVNPGSDASFQNFTIRQAMVGQILVGNLHPVLRSAHQYDGVFMSEGLQFVYIGM